MTPYGNAGGLLGLDDEQLKKLMAGLGLTEEDRRSAKNQAMIMAGLGMMAGARKGQEMQGLAGAGLLGLQTYRGELGNASAGKMDALKARSMGMDYLTKERAFTDDSTERDVMSKFKPPQQAIPPGGPTLANAATMATAPKSGIYEQLLAKADALDAAGLAKRGDALRTAAEKYAPQFDTTPRYGVGANGERVAYVLDKSGNSKTLPIGPDMEKAHFADNGGAIMPLDPFTGKPRSDGVQKQATPGEIMSNEVARGNLGVAQAHLGLARQKASEEKATAYGTPLQITTPEGGTSLYVPRKGTNEVVPMVDQQGNAVTKSASIPQDYKTRAYNLANLRDNITAYNELVKNLKPGDLVNPKVAADLKAKFGATQMGMKNLFELGVIAGPDLEILSQNLTDPTSIKGLIQGQVGGLEAQNKVIFSLLDNADKNLASSYNQPVRMHAQAAPVVVNQTALFKAREAIKAGKDPAAVKAHLRANGYSDEGL